jgi:hypothetical protein
MRRFFFGGAACALMVAVALPSAAAESANDCVAIQRSEQTDGIDFELRNHCDRPLSCALGWTLSCENDKGKVTSSAKESVSFAVAKDAAKHTFGSAIACRSTGWRIDDVSWSCAPAK